MDGLHLFRHPGDQARRPSLLALVWHCRRNWTGRKILDCRARFLYRTRTIGDRAAPHFWQEVDLARWHAHLSCVSTEFYLECSESLAVCGTHAQHQGRRPRCGSFSRGLFRPAGSYHSPAPRTDLDHRSACFPFLSPAEALPVPRLVLYRRFRRLRRSQGQELLSWADLPGLPGSRRHGDRKLYRSVASSVAKACADRTDSCRRSLACPSCYADSSSGTVHFLYGEAAFQSAPQRAQPHARGPPATLRRSIRMGRDSR